MNIRIISILCFLFVGVNASCADSSLATDKDKTSYIAGFQIGQSLKRDGMDIDTAILKQAIDDVMSDKKPKMNAQEMQEFMQALQQRRVKEKQALAETNKKAGEEFLAANKKKIGIVALPNGLQYKILTKGKGGKPKVGDTVTVHYRGTLVDGKEFDSSHKHGKPAIFRTNAVIKGWQEILPMMPQGSKWQVFIPANLAYGPAGAGALIGPNSTLIFEIELLEIKPASKNS